MPRSAKSFRSRGDKDRRGGERQRKRDYDQRKQTSAQRGYGYRWQQARLAWLKQYPLCVSCEKHGRVVPARIVDHVVPHDGDQTLFWDRGNWQSLCKPCHDRKTLLEDGGFGVSWHPEWLRPSVVPLTIVCGPPASGKSIYVKRHAGSDDLVIDLDVIGAELSGATDHDWSRDYLNAAGRERNRLLGELSKERTRQWPAAWLIVTEPRWKHRQWWADKMNPVAIIVMEVPMDECLKRIEGNEARQQQRYAIERWWEEYDPRPGDQVIRANP